jgi:hypothetical protein
MSPLPNISNCLIVDNSALEDLQSCPWMYYVKHILRRVPVAGKAPLIFGGAIHAALKVRYATLLHEPCTEPVQAAMLSATYEHMQLHPPPAQDHRQYELAEAFIRMYNQVYRREPFFIVKHGEKNIVELPFVFELGVLSNGQKVLYSGRMDLVIRDTEGTWVFDHKTTFEYGLGFEDIMRVTPQMRGYAYACKTILGIQPTGYVVNAIRVRRPKKSDEYAVAGEGSVRPDDFKRVREHLSYHELDEWHDNTLNLCEELVYYHSKGTFPTHRKSCYGIYGRCHFYDCCLIKRDQREGFLQSHVFEQNDWSPLNQPVNLPVTSVTGDKQKA